MLFLPIMNYFERENHPQSQPIQQAELHALISACQLSRQSVNIYTDNQYVFGVANNFECYGNKGIFICPLGPQSKNGQVNNLLTAIPLSYEIAIINTKAHTERTEPEYQGDAPTVFHAKTATGEPIKAAAHEDEAHHAWAENGVCCQTFAILMSL